MCARGRGGLLWELLQLVSHAFCPWNLPRLIIGLSCGSSIGMGVPINGVNSTKVLVELERHHYVLINRGMRSHLKWPYFKQTSWARWVQTQMSMGWLYFSGLTLPNQSPDILVPNMNGDDLFWSFGWGPFGYNQTHGACRTFKSIWLIFFSGPDSRDSWRHCMNTTRFKCPIISYPLVISYRAIENNHL